MSQPADAQRERHGRSRDTQEDAKRYGKVVSQRADFRQWLQLKRTARILPGWLGWLGCGHRRTGWSEPHSSSQITVLGANAELTVS